MPDKQKVWKRSIPTTCYGCTVVTTKKLVSPARVKKTAVLPDRKRVLVIFSIFKAEDELKLINVQTLSTKKNE